MLVSGHKVVREVEHADSREHSDRPDDDGGAVHAVELVDEGVLGTRVEVLTVELLCVDLAAHSGVIKGSE